MDDRRNAVKCASASRCYWRLLFSLLVVISSSASSTELSSTISKNVGGAAFSIDIPQDWVAVNTEGGGSLNGSNRLLDLVPSDSRSQGRIAVVYYPDKVPITAQIHWEAFTPDGNVELPRIENQPGWQLLGKTGRIRTGYYQIGGGTLVMDLPGVDYERSEKAFVAVIRSFKDLSATPTGLTEDQR
jgi:hypothetical protein